MSRPRFAVLVLACASCGCQVVSAADAGAPVGTDAASTDADDGGPVCSPPSVSVDCTSQGGSMYTVDCTTASGRLIIVGQCIETVFTVRCFANGQVHTFTENQPCNCGEPATFAPPVHQCDQ